MAATSLIAQGAQPGIKISDPLHLSPNPITLGQNAEATFTVVNSGDMVITLSHVVAAAREDSSGANIDFPTAQNITLSPGQSYTYRQMRQVTTAANTAWPAVYYDNTWLQLGPLVPFGSVDHCQPTIGQFGGGFFRSPALRCLRRQAPSIYRFRTMRRCWRIRARLLADFCRED